VSTRRRARRLTLGVGLLAIAAALAITPLALDPILDRLYPERRVIGTWTKSSGPGCAHLRIRRDGDSTYLSLTESARGAPVRIIAEWSGGVLELERRPTGPLSLEYSIDEVGQLRLQGPRGEESVYRRADSAPTSQRLGGLSQGSDPREESESGSPQNAGGGGASPPRSR